MKRLLFLLPIAAFAQPAPPPKVPDVPKNLPPQIETLQPGVKLTRHAAEPLKAPNVPSELPPQIEVLQPGVKLTLLAEHPDLVTPIGSDVNAKGSTWLVSSHTHFPPQGYAGPAHDEIMVFDHEGKHRRVFYNKTSKTILRNECILRPQLFSDPTPRRMNPIHFVRFCTLPPIQAPK